MIIVPQPVWRAARAILRPRPPHSVKAVPQLWKDEYLKFNQSNLGDGDVKHFLSDFAERNSFTDYEVTANFTADVHLMM